MEERSACTFARARVARGAEPASFRSKGRRADVELACTQTLALNALDRVDEAAVGRGIGTNSKGGRPIYAVVGDGVERCG